MTPQVIRSSIACRDLDEIWDNVAEHNLGAADRLVERIDAACKMLALNAEMGEAVPEFAERGYRRFTVRNYVIYYRPVHDGIMVARVLHGARDHGPLLEP